MNVSKRSDVFRAWWPKNRTGGCRGVQVRVVTVTEAIVWFVMEVTTE